jgi:hypothetical protein
MGIFSAGSCQQTGISPLFDLQEFAVIARPLRRTGPIPFAPFPPLADHPVVAASRESRDNRARSRWLAAPHAAHTLLAGRHAPIAPQHSFSAPTSKPAAPQPTVTSSDTSPDTARAPRGSCHAIYHGQGTLSVLSSITGHHYRFEGRGCTLTIDPRDRMVLGRLSELSIHSASI